MGARSKGGTFRRVASTAMAAGLVAMMLQAVPATAQVNQYAAGIAAAKITATSPRDFNGVWTTDRFIPRFSENPPFQPWAKAKFESYKPQDDPGARCLPSGWPRHLASPYPFEFMQMPNFTLMYFEVGNQIRRIWTDGRKHPEDLDPSWYGHSIGWWEGDVFVVDTIGINDKQFLDSPGDPKTEKLHTIERWQLLEGGAKMQVEITIDDPGAYTAPFSQTRTFFKTGEEVMEYICNENNRNDPANPGPGQLIGTNEPTPYRPFTGIVSNDPAKKADEADKK